MFKVLHTCQEKSPQNPRIKTANIITRFNLYSSRLPQDEILPVFLKFYQHSLRLQILSSLSTRLKYQHYAPREQLRSSFPTRENINIMHQGNSFSALSPQEKISILCTKGTTSQLFPNKRKHQYYPPREQLLSFFFQQKQVILITTRHFIDHVGVTNQFCNDPKAKMLEKSRMVTRKRG